MIDLLSATQVLLRDAGYAVRLSTIQKSPLVSFEDGTVIGFCSVFEQPAEVITKWRSRETEILTRFAPCFRAGGDKAWNVYCVFLCSVVPSKTESREIAWVEEDLNRTRKIAASGIRTRDELVRVFLPVLPFQYQPRLIENDFAKRLEVRIGEIAPRARAAALDLNLSPEEVVRFLGDRT
jgi:hypothetical protein